jgi:type II secretory pathway pseudopilin PulG
MRIQRSPSRRADPASSRTGLGLGGFTLIEVILALGVSLVVLAALGGVFFGALRLRDRTTALVERTTPLYQALDVVRHDLQAALPPQGVLASTFRNGNVTTAGGAGQGFQFCTASGSIRTDLPWADVQMVTYELRDSANNPNAGRDLVRSVTRNLLSTAVTPDFTEQLLLSNVRDVQVYCYDGSSWLPSWDSTLGDTNLPVAVRISIQMAAESSADEANLAPFEMVVPLMIQARGASTNQTAGATGGGA